MIESRLLAETRELLNQRTQSLREISEASDINYHWLRKFLQGQIDDPGVNKIERLHGYLKRQIAA